MKRSPDQPDHGGPERSPVERLDVLAEQYDLLLRELLEAAVDQLAWDGAEPVAGLTVREQLTLTGRLPGAVASQLEAVAHRIGAVPHMARRFRAGVVTFDQLAGFVRLTARCHGRRLARLDEQTAWLADELAEEGRLQDLVGEAELLLEDTRAPGHAEREERRRVDGERVVWQQDLDGGGWIHAEYDPVGFSTVTAGIQAAADALGRLDADDTDADDRADADDSADTGDRPGGSGFGRRGVGDRVSVKQARADGLHLLAHAFLSDPGAHPDAGAVRAGGGRPARPTMTVLVDLADATPDRFGHLLRRVGGDRVPTLSARLCDALAADAQLLVQLRDGRRPLAELRADDIPAQVRRAVLARDGGCRFGRCNAPAHTLHVHHVNGRNDEGVHDPDELFAACGLHHLRHVHRYGWRPDLDPHTARIVWRHPSGRRFSTMPRHRRPRPRPPDRPPPWAGPPRPPPPTGSDPPDRDLPPEHWTVPPTDLADALLDTS